jgi:hypothetical protein
MVTVRREMDFLAVVLRFVADDDGLADRDGLSAEGLKIEQRALERVARRLTPQ